MPENDDRTMEGSGRRLFLSRTTLCAAGALCLSCTRALASQQPSPGNAGQAPAGGAADARMTFKQVYDFAYTRSVIPLMKALGEEIGREKLVTMLQAAGSKAAAEQVRKTAPPPPKNTLAAFVGPEQQDYFWSHVVSMKRVENTSTAVEVRVTECLWAATFRGADAAHIGYACVCHPDFAAATAFNPKMRMIRTKTLMQGHECCNHRWVVEA